MQIKSRDVTTTGDIPALLGGHKPRWFIWIACLLVSLFGFPFGKFPLPFFTFEEGLNIRPQTAGNGFDHVIRITPDNQAVLRILRCIPLRRMRNGKEWRGSSLLQVCICKEKADRMP